MRSRLLFFNAINKDQFAFVRLLLYINLIVMYRSALSSPRIADSPENNKRRYSLGFGIKQVHKKPTSVNHPASYDLQMKTMYIMRSIKKTIKENDIQHLVGQRRHKLMTQPQNDPSWIQKTCHDALINIRKKYDAAKKQRICKLQQTQKLKERLKTFQVQQRDLKQKVQRSRSNSIDMQDFRFKNETQLQEKKMQKKVMLHMVFRLKYDINFYKAQIIKSKRRLGGLRHKIKTLNIQEGFAIKESDNSTGLLSQLREALQKQHKQRKQHTEHLKQMVHNKFLQQESELQRLKFEQQEAENALLAKDEQERNWEALFLSHLFLKKLLINKMKKEKEKFIVIEKAYQKITHSTSVKDPSTLVDKFLTKEQYYGELLGEISRIKETYNQLKQQNIDLLSENKKLQDKALQMKNYQYELNKKRDRNKQSNSSLFNKEISLNGMRDRSTKLKEWLLRQLLKINRIDPSCQFNQKFYSQSIPQLMTIYLFNITKQLQQSEKQIVQDECLSPIAQSFESKSNNGGKKNMMSTSPTKFGRGNKAEGLSEVQHRMFNSFDEHLTKQLQQQNLEKEDEQVNIISIQRHQILKGNEKFMKQVRSKHRNRKI